MPASGTLDTEWGHGPADNPYRVNVADQHAAEEPLGQRVDQRIGRESLHRPTGLDDNQDGLLNDRPAGVGIWTLRPTPERAGSNRRAYTLIPIAGRPAGPPQRYRVKLFANVNNLTNHANL